MDYDSVYVYGIVDGNISKVFKSEGIGDRKDPVCCLPYKDITAVVSNTPFEEYDPTEEHTLAHESVIQSVLKEGLTIAPMRFCTILKSRVDVKKLMRSAYSPFKNNILKIRGKLEFDVKVFLDVEKLRIEVRDDAELIEKSRKIAAELNGRLDKIADESVLDEQITGEMIMNASFLVPREKFKEFQREIHEFDKNHTSKLTIRISGPTAPYNFVNMPTRISR